MVLTGGGGVAVDRLAFLNGALALALDPLCTPRRAPHLHTALIS